MKLSRVQFVTDDYRLGTGSGNEAKATFIACAPVVRAPDDARPIPPKPGVSIDLVAGGTIVLLRSTDGAALMVPVARVKEMFPALNEKESTKEKLVYDARQLKELAET